VGQQIFPSDNPWNQNISNAPVAANSAAIISHIGTSIDLHPDWGADNPANGNSPLYGIPVNIVHGNSTAKVNVIIDNYPGESDITPVPIPTGAVIEGDYQNGPNPNGGGYDSGQRGDSHLIIWDEDSNIAYELYGVTRPSDPTLFPNTSGVELPHTDGLWHAAQETVWNMNTDTFRTLGATSADAAGLSILAGLVRPDEGLPVSQGGQGAIDHALRFTLPSGDVNPQYVYPASHMVSTSQGANNLPLGSRLRLENTPAIDALINSMPPESQVIARAMQQYGLILADIGSAMYVTGSSATVDNVDSPSTDLTWNLNDIFASNGLETLTAGDFQVVNLAPVVTGLSASSGAAGSTITINGQNFSGAAGHLSVLFGSTPATSVTFVSDSQITAVVPSGVGTVDVTVQLGVSETDNISDNPNANVNAPVFGYGTLAPSSADTFTYSSQTISGGSSTASLASSTVVSGSTDLLTIVVEDTIGKPVAGLASSAFGLALSGGTSTGTFSAVTAATTAGTYTATFTGTTAGTASTLITTVGGVTLNATPRVQVTAVTYPPPMDLRAIPGNGSVTFSFHPVSTPVSDYPYAELKNGTLYPIYVGFGNPFTITADNSGPLVNGMTYTFEVAITYASGNTSTWSSPVTVTVGGSTTAAPTVTGVTPARGPASGGTQVTILGTNFTGTTGVSFGGTAATSFKVVSATQITAVAPAGTAGRTVDIVVTTAGGASATSSVDRFRFVAAPVITTQPSNVTVTAGHGATFKVAASGDGLGYQWQKKSAGGSWVNVSSSNTSSFTGATTAGFTITSPRTTDAGTYRVVVSNVGGSVASNAVTLTVNAASTAVPTSTSSPGNQTVAGSSIVTMAAVGDEVLGVFTNGAGQAITSTVTFATASGTTRRSNH
jgi:hypothetical protein